jgi:hypothetical protein
MSRTVSSYTADYKTSKTTTFLLRVKQETEFETRRWMFSANLYSSINLCVEKQDRLGSCIICMGAYITRLTETSHSQYEITEIQPYVYLGRNMSLSMS